MTASVLTRSVLRVRAEAVRVKYFYLQVEVKFERIRRSVEGKPYQASVSQTIFSLNSRLSNSNEIRSDIDSLWQCRNLQFANLTFAGS